MCHYTRRHNSLRIELNPRMNRSKQRQQRQKELCCLCLLLFKFPAVIFDAVYRLPSIAKSRFALDSLRALRSFAAKSLIRDSPPWSARDARFHPSSRTSAPLPFPSSPALPRPVATLPQPGFSPAG